MGCLSKEGQYPSTGPPTYQIIKVTNVNHMSMMKTNLTVIPMCPRERLALQGKKCTIIANVVAEPEPPLFCQWRVMTHKCRGSIVVLSISKSVEPNEEQKEMTSGFQ